MNFGRLKKLPKNVTIFAPKIDFLSKVFIRTLVILAQKFKFRTKIGIMSQCVIAYSVRKKKFLKDGDLENSRVNGNMMIVIWDLRTCNAVSLVTATQEQDWMARKSHEFRHVPGRILTHRPSPHTVWKLPKNVSFFESEASYYIHRVFFINQPRSLRLVSFRSQSFKMRQLWVIFKHSVFWQCVILRVR